MVHSNRNRERSKSRSRKKKSKKSKKEHNKKYKIDSSPEIHRDYNDINEKYDATGHKYGPVSSKKDICGYTNDSNPFMDPILTEQFIWKKKTHNIPLDCYQKEMELKSVQKRLEENERLRQERLIEHDIIQRAKEIQNCGGRKTDSAFDLDQAKIRSKIRITGNRGKPIDLLIQYVNEENNFDDDTDAIIHEPTQYLFGLSEEDLDDVIVDIHDYSKNMEPGKNTQYWDDIRIVAEDELSKIKKTKINTERNEGVATECIEEMRQMILDGTTEEAMELCNDAENMLLTGDPRHIDVAYYEFFCKLAKVMLAKRRLGDRHSKNLLLKLNQLKHEQGLVNDHGDDVKNKVEEIVPTAPTVVNSQQKQSAIDKSDCREEYYFDKYEPVLVSELGDDALGCIVYQWEQDVQKLAFMRRRFLEVGSVVVMSDKEEALLRLARQDDEKGDVPFGIDEQLHQEELSFLWSDKYRPRKPRFLNRVNTGFDWNKYNQTHYDIDNPPPKIVQGYKFNILYPDLIDKTKTPTYELSVCSDNDQQAIITFRAGPPYQDIAFKLVNKEWETSERYGYKCQFYRDMLQLHFHFKRYRYRK